MRCLTETAQNQKLYNFSYRCFKISSWEPDQCQKPSDRHNTVSSVRYSKCWGDHKLSWTWNALEETRLNILTAYKLNLVTFHAATPPFTSHHFQQIMYWECTPNEMIGSVFREVHWATLHILRIYATVKILQDIRTLRKNTKKPKIE